MNLKLKLLGIGVLEVPYIVKSLFIVEKRVTSISIYSENLICNQTAFFSIYLSRHQGLIKHLFFLAIF